MSFTNILLEVSSIQLKTNGFHIIRTARTLIAQIVHQAEAAIPGRIVLDHVHLSQLLDLLLKSICW